MIFCQRYFGNSIEKQPKPQNQTAFYEMYCKLHFIKFMQEIFNKLNKQNQPEKKEIEFETNPHRLIGASMTKEHRLLYFETEQTEPLYIDFIPYNGTTDTIFLIPSGHLLYLPNSTTHFHCINVPYSCINDFELSWFYIYK